MQSMFIVFASGCRLTLLDGVHARGGDGRGVNVKTQFGQAPSKLRTKKGGEPARFMECREATSDTGKHSSVTEPSATDSDAVPRSPFGVAYVHRTVPVMRINIGSRRI
jgi:hypothetical protein